MSKIKYLFQDLQEVRAITKMFWFLQYLTKLKERLPFDETTLTGPHGIPDTVCDLLNNFWSLFDPSPPSFWCKEFPKYDCAKDSTDTFKLKEDSNQPASIRPRSLSLNHIQQPKPEIKMFSTDYFCADDSTVTDNVTIRSKGPIGPIFFPYCVAFYKKMFDFFGTSDYNGQPLYTSLFRFLLELQQCNRWNLNERLTKLIEETEALIVAKPKYIKYTENPSFNKGDELTILRVGCFALSVSMETKASDILNLILRIDSNKFTKEEEMILADTFVYALYPIVRHMWFVSVPLFFVRYSTLLEKKKALQIIIQDYAKFFSPEIPEYKSIVSILEHMQKIDRSRCDDSVSDSGSDSCDSES